MPFFFFLFLYFVAIVGGATLLVFPGVRSAAWEKTQTIITSIGRFLGQITHQSGKKLHTKIVHTKQSAQKALPGLWVKRYLIILGVLILILPTSIAFLKRNDHYFSYSTPAAPDSKILALLSGERLVAPEPLPPEVFTTREVEQVRPLISQANRDWDLLDADFRQRLLLVYRIMKEDHGYEMVMIEGYRSPERQEKLASMGAHVTNARAYQSYHQHGLAADSAFYRNGKIVISEKDPWAMEGYRLYGETAEKVGLTWGGRWKMMDFGHVEFRRPK